MSRLRKECDDLKAAEIRALKAKKEGETREAEEGNAARSTDLLDIKKEEEVKKEVEEGGSGGLEDSKVGYYCGSERMLKFLLLDMKHNKKC
jgi:hypothetical protein